MNFYAESIAQYKEMIKAIATLKMEVVEITLTGSFSSEVDKKEFNENKDAHDYVVKNCGSKPDSVAGYVEQTISTSYNQTVTAVGNKVITLSDGQKAIFPRLESMKHHFNYSNPEIVITAIRTA